MRAIQLYLSSWTLLVCSVGGLHSDEQGYLIAVPSVFHAGVEEAVSVTLFNTVEETQVHVQLSVMGETLAQSHGTVLHKGTIKLKVPSDLRGQAVLRVSGKSHLGEGGYVFSNQTTVTVNSKSLVVFIQTDKPIYKPGQKVLIHVYSITPDLRPVSNKIEAYILDPRGSHMVQWKNLQPICCGIVNISFPLSDQPVLGEWLVLVKVQDHTYNKSFEVQKYVLPRFELSVVLPPYIRYLNSCEQATVNARYMFGKPVSGKLMINATVNGVGYYSHEMGHPVVRTMEIEGSATFSLCVKEMMPPDVPDHFRGAVHMWVSVTSVDGARQTLFDDSTPVHKQLIDIKFSKNTRKQFKAGLPYKGKIEVLYPDGSPADGVQVRVKAELTPKDNIFITELTSMNGEATFEIPSIPAAAQYIWLEAKVMTIDGAPVGDQYLPSYLSISSWYSPSKCHIQLQSPAAPFTIGQEAEVLLKSTCPCNFTLHYEITSRGNIVQSGFRHYPNSSVQNSESAAVMFNTTVRSTSRLSADSGSTGALTQDETDICVSALLFPVSAAMMPASRLLVYYIREDGEGVTDSIQIPVAAAFENQVSVSMSTNETRPGSPVNLQLRGERGSCVCVATVDKSIYLLKPGFRLTPEKVFGELLDFDITDSFRGPKDDRNFWWHGRTSRRRRSSLFPWYWGISKDSRLAFTEAGLIVMTDVVRLSHRQVGGLITDEAIPAFQPHTSTQSATHSPPLPRAETHRRTFFPETWIWHCLNVSNSTGEAELRLTVPDSITTWVTEAVGLSMEKGMGLSQPVELRTFKPFFVDFSLPYSVVRGEQTKVLLTVYNYLSTCAEVHVKVSVPKGIKFVGHPGKHHLTRRKCVAPGAAAPTSIVLSFTELLTANIYACAVAFSKSSCCDEGLQPGKMGKAGGEQEDLRGPENTDCVRRSVLVEPEGLPREYTYSVFFCPNEHIHISTPNKYEYQYLKKPSKATHIEVAVKTHSDAHIALSPGAYDSTEMVEVVLGGRQNTLSWISVGKMGEPVSSVSTAGIVSGDEFRRFWISWKAGGVQVGYGTEPSNQSLILQWTGPIPAQVTHIGFSTGWGSAGEFKIWRKDLADENHNEVFTLGVPHSVVPGSERATASIIGDVMGPALNNLNKLLRLPFGCGEQNMIHFAPNIFVLKYLQKTHQLTPEVETEAIDYLLQGYQRQLTYRRQDGAYSAFGERDSSGSMWLTAFVLKSFAQSRSYIFIDPEELQAAKSWLISHQREDGSFPSMGRVLNKDIQGGIHSKISLTAYVVASLFETGITTEKEKLAFAKARKFLEKNIYSANDPYTTALSAYALVLLQSLYASLAVRRLNHMAITHDGCTHWTLSGSAVTDDETFLGFSDGISQSVTSAEVEMTAYALLTYTLLEDVASAFPVVKWLSKQRNALGGFSSTQDTCVALQALAEYAILSYIGGVNVTVSLASTNLDFQETFELHQDNQKILQKAKIPSIPTGLFVSAKGEGCSLMQIDVSYNVPDPVSKPAFQLLVELKHPGQRPTHSLTPQRFSSSLDLHAHNHTENHRKRRSSSDDEDPASHHDHVNYRLTMEVCTRYCAPSPSNPHFLFFL